MSHGLYPRLLRASLSLAASLSLLTGCAQTRLVDSWQSEQSVDNKPDKVAVVAVLPESLVRKAVEIDVARILSDDGTPAVASSELPGMSGGIRGEIDPQAAARLLRQAGVDGVIVMFYAGGGRSEDYVRADYWAEYVGTGVAYNWAQPYFVDVYAIRKGEDVRDFQQVAYVESSFFDLETEQPVWRIVTKTNDVEHTDAARDIAKKIAAEMRSANLN